MKNKGFTLIELLVTIAIIGLLASLLLLSLSDFRARSRDTRRVADIKSLRDSLALYQVNFGGYPAQATEAIITGSDNMSTQLITNNFIQGPIIDPLNSAGYVYYYQSLNNNKNYVIRYCLETTTIKGKTQDCNNTVSP